MELMPQVECKKCQGKFESMNMETGKVYDFECRCGWKERLMLLKNGLLNDEEPIKVKNRLNI